ncbi:TonB-dependent receptor [Noviherbaspirillum denitrificans]|uniref:TonB-dependent receptor n=1 Tax=Noviherbaspirillum denitrificans TaxID=1968433 RepID=A0A254TKC0_9BURK|nr:TonB-dependent siderophore receptor [Noviherbaspirillum denitrificans]OWW21762.1 TonB-dependent receptor [Noviherbaspirillum denitrificans]
MNLKKTELALLAALAVQQLAAPAFAQSKAAEADLPEVKVKSSREAPPTYNPPTASSATKVEAPLRDIPQTVNVVPQTLLRDQGAKSMQDVMKMVPGIGLSHGDGQRDQVTIRGFTAIADQFIDGLRDDAMYFRDLSNIEQVEIIKGPASVLYGRGSSGGLINRITKKPGTDKSEVSVTVGSWGQRRGEFDVGRNFEDSGVAFRVTGAIERADSYRDQQFLDREAISPSLSFRLSDQTRLLLQAEYLSDRRVTDFGVPSYRGLPVDVAPGTYYGAANARNFDYSQADVNALGFTLDHRFSDTLSLRNAFRRYTYSLDRNNTLVGLVNEAALTASLNRSNVMRDEDGYFNQTELVQKAAFGGMAHQILYGVEFGKQDKDQFFRTQNNIATVSLFNPVAPVVPFTVTAAPSTNNLGILKTAGAYVQDLVSLSDQWKAMVGLRYDNFQQETQERRVGQPNLNRTDTAWSPRAGLVYQPTEAQSYYASFSKSFQPSGESFPLAVNNAQIAPEETTNKEVGAKFDFFDGKASATASLFRLERTNIKSTDPATNRLVPVGTQRTDGLELTFTGDLSQGWQVWTGYSYLEGKVTSSIARDAGQPVQGKRPTLTPKHAANVWVTKALGDGFGLGAGVSYVGDRFANPGNTVTLPGYTTVDAMAYYRMGPLDLTLNVMNLFDREYIVSGHGSSANLNLPGAPRSVQLTARYKF